MSLKALLEPSSIAVIGASPREGSLGHAVLLNLLERFPGRVYAVNPRGGEVRGLRFLRSLEELPPVEAEAVEALPAEEGAPVVAEATAAEEAVAEEGEAAAGLEELEEWEEEEQVPLAEPKPKGRKKTPRELVYDEELGRVISIRRHRRGEDEEWEDYM